MKLASIEVIKEIVPHKGADKLEIAKVLGWQSIVKKGEFKAGDKVVFVVIDTILPLAPWSQFLADKNNPEKPIRLCPIRLRGEHSAGLVLPLSVLPENVQGWHEGADVGGALGIKKYEKEIPAQLSGIALGPFPSYLTAQTDEENGLSNPDLVAEVLKSEWITVTLKYDGSSGTIIIEDGVITHVCSRRLTLKETEENAFWKAARKLDASQYDDGRYIISGEIMGCGVQGNQLKLMSPEIFVFQIKYMDDFYTYSEMRNECETYLKCRYVPLVGDFHTKNSKITLADLQALADEQVLPCGSPAEGIVVRPMDYRASGEGRPLGFKIINRNYKD